MRLCSLATADFWVFTNKNSAFAWKMKLFGLFGRNPNNYKPMTCKNLVFELSKALVICPAQARIMCIKNLIWGNLCTIFAYSTWCRKKARSLAPYPSFCKSNWCFSIRIAEEWHWGWKDAHCGAKWPINCWTFVSLQGLIIWLLQTFQTNYSHVGYLDWLPNDRAHAIS